MLVAVVSLFVRGVSSDCGVREALGHSTCVAGTQAHVLKYLCEQAINWKDDMAYVILWQALLYRVYHTGVVLLPTV